MRLHIVKWIFKDHIRLKTLSISTSAVLPSLLPLWVFNLLGRGHQQGPCCRFTGVSLAAPACPCSRTSQRTGWRSPWRPWGSWGSLQIHLPRHNDHLLAAQTLLPNECREIIKMRCHHVMTSAPVHFLFIPHCTLPKKLHVRTQQGSDCHCPITL